MQRLSSIVLTLLSFASLFSGGSSSGAERPPVLENPKQLFDGRSLAGWEGNPQLWRVQDGALTGGSYETTVVRNEFLATTRNFTNFIIQFQIRLTGSNGFINSGFQMRSQRVPNSSEMAGYQCDYGEPNWYGAIYDESRRNQVMSWSDMKTLRPVLKLNDGSWQIMRGKRLQPWVGLPNILCREFVVPELLQEQATPEAMAAAIGQWLDAPERMQALRQRFAKLHTELLRDTPRLATDAIEQVLAA